MGAFLWAMTRKTAAQREKEELTASILFYFTSVTDPRVERTRRHSLVDILVLSSLNLLKSLKGSKLSIKIRRVSAAWSQDFLLKVLLAHSDVG